MAQKRSISSYTHFVTAPPGKVFPLLCPVREYEWIDVWQGKLLYSESGVAEMDCVFIAAPFEELGPEVWTCTRYEPAARIDYNRVSPHSVIRLQLDLVPAGTGTRITATMVFTALDDIGTAFVSKCGPGTCAQGFQPCFLMLDHFVRTGTMLPAADARAIAAGTR